MLKFISFILILACINTQAIAQTHLQYDYIGEPSEGIRMVSKAGKWGYIDAQGREIIKPQYNQAHPFFQGIASVELNKKWGFIDTKNTSLIPFQYDATTGFESISPSINMAAVMIDKKWGCINPQGNIIIPLLYDNVFTCGNNNRIVLFKNYKVSLVDGKNKTIVPFIYEDISCFTDGLARVMLNNKYGYINLKGKIIIPIQYTQAYEFSEGKAEVSIGKESTCIDKKGKDIGKCWK